jgi:class 3 adenylate cyclase/tetratricopeptide (TPR) repeat protein
VTVCSACGADNRASARFCDECGAPLEAIGPSETRKVVTVLFCDLVAFTSLGEQLDPESLRLVISRYFDEATAVLDRHGATITGLAGDEVMAVFGVPAVREDDALRAVTAAVEMRGRVTALESGLGSGAVLQVRIGVNTGEVVATDLGRDRGFDVTGDAISVGKRIETAAAPGEILLGHDTHALVAHAVEAAALGPTPVKGRERPVEMFRLDSVDAGAGAIPRRLDAPLVGREAELAQLRATLADATGHRRARTVLVLANAGIGKSRLARELLATAAPEVTPLVGRCPPFGEGTTFSPLREVFKQAGVDPGVLDAASFEVFAATRRLLEEASAQGPVLLVLDDVHWAEETFLDLIEHLRARLDTCVLVLCLARPELAERRPVWLEEMTMMRLEPISEAESEQLLEALGAPAGARARIAEAAEGNPLFLEQFAAIADDASPAPIAGSVRAVLQARLDRLARPESSVLERAAVVGRSFTLVALLELSTPAERDQAQARVFELVRKGLIRPDTTAPEEGFCFQHALVRDVVYESMPKALRAELHERVAARLEAGGASSALIGHHLEQAFRRRSELTGPDGRLGARAGRTLLEAAQESSGRSDYPAAVSLLERARDLLSAEDPILPLLLTELGYARVHAGDMPAAEAALDEAVLLAASLGDRGAELRAQIQRQFARTFVAQSASAAENLRVADEALPELEQLGDELALARAWWLKSSSYVISCRLHKRAEALEEALAHARRARTRQDLVGTLSGLLAQALLHGPTPVEEAIPIVEQMAVDAGRDRAVAAAIDTNLAGLLAMTGSIEEARRVYANAAATYEEFGLRFRRASQAFVGARIEQLAGNLSGAERELRESSAALAEIGASSTAATHRAMLADVLCSLGELSDAQALADEVSRTAPADDLIPQVLWRTVSARVLARRGAVAEAWTHAEAALRLSDEVEFPHIRVAALTAAAEVAAARGHTADAGTQLDLARRLLAEKGNVVEQERIDLLARELARAGSVA